MSKQTCVSHCSLVKDAKNIHYRSIKYMLICILLLQNGKNPQQLSMLKCKDTIICATGTRLATIFLVFVGLLNRPMTGVQ